jgi:hypothetical protein
MRLADEIVALVVEGGVEEEPLVLYLEVLVLLANPSLAEGEELLALGESAHGDGPFLESDWHGVFCVRGRGSGRDREARTRATLPGPQLGPSEGRESREAFPQRQVSD